jgi:hypothetical protein
VVVLSRECARRSRDVAKTSVTRPLREIQHSHPNAAAASVEYSSWGEGADDMALQQVGAVALDVPSLGTVFRAVATVGR